MTEIQTFILSLVSGSSASALVVWLARNWMSERIKNSIKHEYDSKLETHKAQLTFENSTTIEKLKSQLLEQHVQFTSVYAKREELLSGLHKKLNETINVCLTATAVGVTQISQETKKQFVLTHSAMEEAAVYFPDDFCDRWHQRVGNLHETLERFIIARESKTGNWSVDLAESKKTYDEHLLALKNMRSELRTEIRKWLGTLN